MVVGSVLKHQAAKVSGFTMRSESSQRAYTARRPTQKPRSMSSSGGLGLLSLKTASC